MHGLTGKEAGSSLRVAMGGFLAMAAAMGIGRFAYTPILPFMVADRGLTGGAAGLVASANFLGYLIGAIAAAFPVLRGSRRTWMLGALAASALTTLLMGVSDHFESWLVLRFAGGMASAFVLVFSSALVLDRIRTAGSPGLAGMHFAGVGAGIIASSLAVGLGAAGGLGWRGLWLACGAISFAALAGSMALIPPEPAQRTQAAPEGRLAWKSAWPLVAAYGLFGFGYVVTATFLVLMVRGSPEARGLEPVVWLIVGAAGIPSVALWTALGERIGPLTAYAAAALVEAVGVGASIVLPTTAGFTLAAVLLGGTFMGLTALGIAGGRATNPQAQRTVTAVMTAAFGLGQIAGPALAGFIVDLSGSFAPANAVACGALLLSAAFAVISARCQPEDTA